MREHFHYWQVYEPGIEKKDEHESAIQHDQIFDDRENDRLEMTHGRGRAYEFGRFAKVRAGAGGDDFPTCFTTDHHGSSKCSLTGSCFEAETHP